MAHPDMLPKLRRKAGPGCVAIRRPGLCRAALILVALAHGTGCSRPHADPPSAVGSLPLAADPPRLDLGTLEPGRTAEGAITLIRRGPGGDPVTVARIETSCPCVRLATVPAAVENGRPARVVVTFDSAEEPDFRGDLAVSVTGFAPDGTTAFRSTVAVGVSAGPSESIPSSPPKGGAK